MDKKLKMQSKISAFVPAWLLLFGAGPALAGNVPPTPQQQQQTQAQQQQPKAKFAGTPHVDLVIALDTSSSMDGLIDSARAKLWDVVNLLARAKPQPVVRIGLISYGNDGYDASKGWVRKESDLTTDLDSVYSKLFALHTNGGTEYVARAVHDAIHDMQWDPTEQTLRIVFVAGNEPADQDPTIPLQAVAKDAVDHHIRVNTIYCANEGNLEKVGWERLASLGRGGYGSIDQTDVAAIPTPMDAELAQLSTELNSTYIAFGKAAAEKKANQAQQDKNASTMGTAAAATRAQAKATKLYDAKDWDLVDAQRASGGAALAATPVAHLPPMLAAMPAPARAAFVAQSAQKREEIQKKIATISAQRSQFMSSEKAKRAKAGKSSLDDQMTRSIQKEAETDLNLTF